ncbi:MAG: hypothetical protein LUO93_00690 [Methanomicrobiales archaeon]|nr:hypothetical protein [Methanomicrobiales archaeon]
MSGWTILFDALESTSDLTTIDRFLSDGKAVEVFGWRITPLPGGTISLRKERLAVTSPPAYYVRYASSLGDLVELAEETFDSYWTVADVCAKISSIRRGVILEADGFIVGCHSVGLDGEVKYACIGPDGEAMYSMHEHDEPDGVDDNGRVTHRALAEADWSAFGAAKTFVQHVGVRPASEAIDACSI